MRGKTVLPCRPRRDAKERRCPHGRDISCPIRHVEADPRLGRPMCAEDYDYKAAVLFNAYASALWRRFVTYLPRQLARLSGVTGLPRGRLSHPVRQGRGIPGTRGHPLPRRDPARCHTEDYPPPPPGYTAALLAEAIGQAANAVTFTTGPAGPAIRLGFGPRTDTRIVRGAAICRYRAGPGRPGRRELHRQVRDQGPRAPGVPDTIGSGTWSRSRPCAARPITSGWSPSPGSSAARARPANRGFGSGPTSSASAATSLLNPAATRSPSASSAPNAPPAAASKTTRTANATHGTALSTRNRPRPQDLELRGTGYNPATPAAELAIESAVRARGR